MIKVGRFAIAAAAMLLASCNQGAEAPEMTAQQLMANEVQPTAEIYWQAVGDVSELVDGQAVQRHIEPRTDEEWERVRSAAVRLGELGALLQTPGYAEGRGEDWTEIAASLVEVSKLAEQAAAERNPDKVFEVGGTIYNVCTACHQVYPATTGPEAEGQS